jgi:hypothetical protein
MLHFDAAAGEGKTKKTAETNLMICVSRHILSQPVA